MAQDFNWRAAAKRHPVVSMLVIASIIGAAIASMGGPLLSSLLFGGISENQYWRLLTPIFLHFGLVHLAFNLLWLAILGSRIEQLFGSMHLLLLVIATGVFSNMIQVGWSGSPLFGGMSGVIYALLGYIWIKGRFVADPALQLPPGILGFMLIWLLIGMSGVLELVLGVGVANGAHVGGFVIGLLLGLVFGLLAAAKRR